MARELLKMATDDNVSDEDYKYEVCRCCERWTHRAFGTATTSTPRSEPWVRGVT